jgi:hypothetical protein
MIGPISRLKQMTVRIYSLQHAQGVTGGLKGLHVALGDLRGSRVASGGRMWSQGVAGGLRGSGVALGAMGGLCGSQLNSGGGR